jgi:hypothetical protein
LHGEKEGTMARTRVTLHKYPDEVLAEVVVDDGQGDVRTASVEFDVVDDAGTLVPREALPREHADRIRERIEASAHDLEDTRAHARP